MAALDGFTETSFTFNGVTRPVYRAGTGPGVVVVHEVPGITPLVADFGRRLVDAGFTVAMPSLFGEPGRAMSVPYVMQSMWGACVSREFTTWALNRTSPVVEWLRALARDLYAQAGGKGVGAVGMCFTGGYALAMMTEPSVVAPVLSQPSMPIATGSAKRASGFDATEAEVSCAKARMAAEDLSMIGLRFKSDKMVPDARFANYRKTFGDRFEAIELEDEDAAPAIMPPHSVLTLHLRNEGPSKAAEQRVIAFFKERTGA